MWWSNCSLTLLISKFFSFDTSAADSIKVGPQTCQTHTHTRSPRAGAITNGYAYCGDLTCNCWIWEPRRLVLSALHTAQPCGSHDGCKGLSLSLCISLCLFTLQTATSPTRLYLFHSLTTVSSFSPCSPSLLLLLWSISKGPDCSLAHMQRGDTDTRGCVCVYVRECMRPLRPPVKSERSEGEVRRK